MTFAEAPGGTSRVTQMVRGAASAVSHRVWGTPPLHLCGESVARTAPPIWQRPARACSRCTIALVSLRGNLLIFTKNNVIYNRDISAFLSVAMLAQALSSQVGRNFPCRPAPALSDRPAASPLVAGPRCTRRRAQKVAAWSSSSTAAQQPP